MKEEEAEDAVEEVMEKEEEEDAVEEVMEEEKQEEEVSKIEKREGVRNMEVREDFVFDFDRYETEQDVICFIRETISHRAFESFLLSNKKTKYVNHIKQQLNKIETFLTSTTFMKQPANDRMETMQGLLSLAQRVGDLLGELVPRDSGKQFTNSESHDLREDWKAITHSLVEIVSRIKHRAYNDTRSMKLVHLVMDTIRKYPDNLIDLEMFILDEEGRSCRKSLQGLPEVEHVLLEYIKLLLIKAFPAFARLTDSSNIENILLEILRQLGDLPEYIRRACQGNPQAIFLVGGFLSFKTPDYGTWCRVRNDLEEMIPGGATDSLIWQIFSYCLDDLSVSLRQCFLYVACYPIGSEIPTESLTKIWIAEGFITPEKGETSEDIVNKYMDLLVQRSLISVSMRSVSGTIKCCQVHRYIHEFVIRKSCEEKIMFANPDKENINSLERVAIHKDDKNQYMEVTSVRISSFLAFDTDRTVLRSARFLRVLELRKSVVPETVLEKMPHLRYLGLRGSNIFELPKNIGKMKDLQTLDVRNTNVKTLPESLWSISGLRHVYVNHGPGIQGPPPTANIPNLEILKTIGVPESWLEKFPHLSTNLRKLGLSYVGDLKLETISNPLSRMVNLLSIAIIGPIVHAELVDTRAFPNLGTLKSIELVGIWNFRKLSIDNVGFPVNLAKLILSNSRLKEDPMPRLERLQALKLLKLEDRAYMGEKMVSSENGFPQLQFLQLTQLENLKIWEVKPTAMSKLTTLHVVKCQELEINLPDLVHVKDIVIDN